MSSPWRYASYQIASTAKLSGKSGLLGAGPSHASGGEPSVDSAVEVGYVGVTKMPEREDGQRGAATGCTVEDRYMGR